VSEKLVLDSFALVSLDHREPGWQVVQRALYDQEKARRLLPRLDAADHSM